MKRLTGTDPLTVASGHTCAQSVADDEVRIHLRHYIALLNLENEPLSIYTDRREFEEALERRVGSGIGGAYVYQPALKKHLVLINLARIDRSRPKSVEVVVAEELVHMRDWIDGDRRRHAKHGYDRIAYRVSELTGASLEDIRSCLRPVVRRAARYQYRCPGCGRTVQRRLRGTWSCSRCAPQFDARFVLFLEDDAERGATIAGSDDLNRPESSRA